MGPGRLVVVSDLDGTLLDHDTYSPEAVQPSLARLRDAGVTLVLSSSKTRAEIEVVQAQLGVTGGFISENGGGLFLAAGSIPAGGWRVRRAGGCDAIEVGLPYGEVVARLRAAAKAAGVTIRGFADMTAEEIAADSGLSLAQARLAKCRDFGEPFRLLGESAGDGARLTKAAAAQGLTLTRGGRYRHASGPHDKGAAVRLLRAILTYEGDAVYLVGLGDGLNDEPMLAAVDRAVVVRGHDPAMTAELQRRLPGAAVTPVVGPAGAASVIDGSLASWLAAADAGPAVSGPGPRTAPPVDPRGSAT